MFWRGDTVVASPPYPKQNEEEKRVSESGNNADNMVFCCWISEKDRILSFSYIEGYERKEFDTYKAFQEFYYKQTYWGYRVQ